MLAEIRAWVELAVLVLLALLLIHLTFGWNP